MHLQSVDSRAHVHKHIAINAHFISLRRCAVLHGLAISGTQIKKTAFDITPISSYGRACVLKRNFQHFTSSFNLQLDRQMYLQTNISWRDVSCRSRSGNHNIYISLFDEKYKNLFRHLEECFFMNKRSMCFLFISLRGILFIIKCRGLLRNGRNDQYINFYIFSVSF